MNYRTKYLKYKNKYLTLKQKGGMGYQTKTWNTHPDFTKINDTNLTKVILHVGNIIENEQYNDYSLMLNNLLKIDNGFINLDFINNFTRYIYYDLKGIFGINLSNNTWNNDELNKYNITRAITQAHGNTTILFLELKTDKTKKKVLKIFNKIDPGLNGTLYINGIKDYLSLEITHISDNHKFALQTHYNSINKNTFNKINFNNQILEKEFIKTNIPEDYLYLSCRNNDAINDYIINLILQKINETIPDPNKINFVKYDNLFVTQVNGIYKYCIIMDNLDGSLDSYLENIDGIKINDYNELYRILNKIETDLNVLKDKKYLFTHTDMKCENVFYKLSEGIVNPYLADFDKSSITFHNIRFYNDITQSGGVKSTVDPMSFLSAFLVDAYTIKKEQDRKEDIFNYRLSRIGSSSLFTTVEGIETEQTYMRYNYMPYYTSFDMCSLLLSLFNMKKKDDSGPIFNKLPPSVDNLFRLLIRYINSDKLELLMSKYNIANIPKGDFGKLLSLILQVKEEIGECFIHVTDKTLKNPYINKLYLSNQRKICLSIPFTPISALKDSKTNTSVFKFNIDKTNTLYGKLLSTEIIEKYKTIQVEYNTDYAVGAAKGVFGLKDPDIIIITNRYSMLTTLYGKPITYINDYDDVQSDKVKEIFDFIMTTSNTLD